MIATRPGWGIRRSMARSCAATDMAANVEPRTARRTMSNDSSSAQNVLTSVLVTPRALTAD